MINNFSMSVTSWHLAFTLTISWHEYVQQCYKLDAYVTQRSTSWLKCIQHLALVCWRIFYSCILKRKHMTHANTYLSNIGPSPIPKWQHVESYHRILRHDCIVGSKWDNRSHSRHRRKCLLDCFGDQLDANTRISTGYAQNLPNHWD
jgi:hypothetical protein